MKLTKEQAEEFKKLMEEMRDCYNALGEQIDDYNTARVEAQRRINTTLNEYNLAMAKVEGFIGNRAEEWRDEFDEKTDNWKATKAGIAAEAFVESWENPPDMETVEDFEMAEIVAPDSPADDIDDMPTESE